MTELAEPSGKLRRRHKRYGQKGEILLRRALSGPTCAADLFDISSGGCLVWLARSIHFSLSDVVEVRLSAGDLAFRVMGTVRHSGDDGRVAGIEFHRLGASQANSLLRFIADLQTRASPERCWLP